MVDPRKAEGGLIQPIPQTLQPKQNVNLDRLRQSLPGAMASGVGQGFIGSFETALEPFALEMRQSRGLYKSNNTL